MHRLHTLPKACSNARRNTYAQYIYMHTYIHIHQAHARVHVRTHIHIHIHARTHARTQLTKTHTHFYTHIHTHATHHPRQTAIFQNWHGHDLCVCVCVCVCMCVWVCLVERVCSESRHIHQMKSRCRSEWVMAHTKVSPDVRARHVTPTKSHVTCESEPCRIWKKDMSNLRVSHVKCMKVSMSHSRGEAFEISESYPYENVSYRIWCGYD